MHSELMSYIGICNFIIDNELTDSVVIVLHPENFDKVALDYVKLHNNIERPCEILGIEILEDTTGKIAKNKIYLANT